MAYKESDRQNVDSVADKGHGVDTHTPIPHTLETFVSHEVTEKSNKRQNKTLCVEAKEKKGSKSV